MSMPASSFSSLSYELHAERVAAGSDDVPNIIGRPELIDAWNHGLSYAYLEPLTTVLPAASWMTIGDGGGEAFFLERAGTGKVTATCISDAALSSLRERGLLVRSKIRAENAERLSAADDSVDFVLCKDSYHHFPRPPLAFYEMLRVARRGVVLIEPAELARGRALDALKTVAKRLLRGQDRGQQLFEESGNFLFRVSLPELVKMATALQIDSIAYAHFNDLFVLRLASRPQREMLPMLLQRGGVAFLDALCRARLMSWGKLACIAFKEAPDETMRSALRARGFAIVPVPRNPYLTERRP